MPIWLFVDQYNAILPNTLQDIAVGMACMLSISLLLIPQPLCALWVAVSIASIAIGKGAYSQFIIALPRRDRLHDVVECEPRRNLDDHDRDEYGVLGRLLSTYHILLRVQHRPQSGK